MRSTSIHNNNNNNRAFCTGWWRLCNIRDRTPKSRGSLITPLTLGNGRKEELFFLTGRDVQEKEAQGGEAICYKWLMVKEKGSSKCSTSSIFWAWYKRRFSESQYFVIWEDVHYIASSPLISKFALNGQTSMNSKLQYQAVQSSCEGIICLIILMATDSKAVCCFSNTSKKTNKPNLNLSSALTCSGCTDSRLYSAKSYLVVLQIHIFHQWQFLPIQWFCQPNVRWGPLAVWNFN